MRVPRPARPFTPRFVGPFWWQFLLIFVVLLGLLIAVPLVMSPDLLP
jgi:hypothetical protein